MPEYRTTGYGVLGRMPDGTERLFSSDSDYLEAYAEASK